MAAAFAAEDKRALNHEKELRRQQEKQQEKQQQQQQHQQQETQGTQLEQQDHQQQELQQHCGEAPASASPDVASLPSQQLAPSSPSSSSSPSRGDVIMSGQHESPGPDPPGHLPQPSAIAPFPGTFQVYSIPIIVAAAATPTAAAAAAAAMPVDVEHAASTNTPAPAAPAAATTAPAGPAGDAAGAVHHSPDPLQPPLPPLTTTHLSTAAVFALDAAPLSSAPAAMPHTASASDLSGMPAPADSAAPLTVAVKHEEEGEEVAGIASEAMLPDEAPGTPAAADNCDMGLSESNPSLPCDGYVGGAVTGTAAAVVAAAAVAAPKHARRAGRRGRNSTSNSNSSSSRSCSSHSSGASHEATCVDGLLLSTASALGGNQLASDAGIQLSPPQNAAIESRKSNELPGTGVTGLGAKREREEGARKVALLGMGEVRELEGLRSSIEKLAAQRMKQNGWKRQKHVQECKGKVVNAQAVDLELRLLTC